MHQARRDNENLFNDHLPILRIKTTVWKSIIISIVGKADFALMTSCGTCAFAMN